MKVLKENILKDLLFFLQITLHLLPLLAYRKWIIDVVMPMCNLQLLLKTSRRLWQYYRDKPLLTNYG